MYTRLTSSFPLRIFRRKILSLVTVALSLCFLLFVFTSLLMYNDECSDDSAAKIICALSVMSHNVSVYAELGRNTTLLQPQLNSNLQSDSDRSRTRINTSLNRSSCRPFLLVIVHSSPANYEARAAIRETWGRTANYLRIPRAQHANSSDSRDNATWWWLSRYSQPVLVLFLLGTSSSVDVQQAVEAEQHMYNDLIVEQFIDSYLNLTIKSVRMLKWTLANCQCRYLLKADEDMLINMAALIPALTSTAVNDRLIMGALICGAVPQRDRTSKYFVPGWLVTSRYFPNYVSGTAYVLSGSLIGPLLRAAVSMPFFHLEDVFITGYCASAIAVRPRDHAGFSFVVRGNFTDLCVFHRSIAVHGVGPSRMRSVWRLLTGKSQQSGFEHASGRCNGAFGTTRSYVGPYRCRWMMPWILRVDSDLFPSGDCCSAH